MNNFEKPESNISICIPTFNRSDLLRKTLVSVYKQTMKPYEVIVADNCSTDDTESVAKSFKDVIYYKNERNLGLAGNWNRCIELAKGDFLTILHSDDLISPCWYEEMDKLVRKYIKGNAGAFFLPVFTIDLYETTKIVYYSFSRSVLLNAGESINILWKRNMCGLPASGGIVFRKSIFDKIGLFDERYTTETDTLTVLRLLNNFPVYYHKKLLYAYRIHPFQTFDKERTIKSFEKKYSVLKNHLKIIMDFYNVELKKEYRRPFFYKRVVCMYLAIAFFYLLRFNVRVAKRYYSHIKQSIPEITFTLADLFIFIHMLLHYSWAFFIGRFLACPIKSTAKDWVKE